MAKFQAQEVHLVCKKATVYRCIVQFTFFPHEQWQTPHSQYGRIRGWEKMAVQIPATKSLFMIRIYEFRI